MRRVKHCAYLTMREPGDFVTDYELSIPALVALGWRVETVVWDDPSVDWNAFDAVYICTPWDYPDKLEQFVGVLDAIDHSSALLINDLELVRWNLSKTYLRDLEERGGEIVPSIWLDEFDPRLVAEGFARFATDRIVIKPQMGANAVDTFILTDPVAGDVLDRLATTFADRKSFLQPFMPGVQAEGEYSLFFFGQEYSHTILKVPAAGDFRSQEEHGAEIFSRAPPSGLRAAGDNIMRLVEPAPVYARADFVRNRGGEFLLMELELIEPSLYLRMDDRAADRFAVAIDRHVRE